MQNQILSCMVGWAKAHHFYSLEFEERGVSLGASMRTWEKDPFRRVAVAVTDRFAVDATHKLSVLGSVVAAVGGSASLVAVSGRSHVLAATPTAIIWEVGTATSRWSTQSLICIS